MLAQKLMMASGGGSFALPTFDGSGVVHGNEKRGFIVIFSSGNITFEQKGKVDIFLLGGGKSGVSSGGGSGFNMTGGQGSAGLTEFGVEVQGEYPIFIAGSGGTTTALGFSRVSGGGASGGRSATSSSKAGSGGNGTSYPFGETTGPFVEEYGLMKYGAGGGGGSCATYIGYTGIGHSGEAYSQFSYSHGSGGTLGGGAGGRTNGQNGVSGTANTGSGGGGGGYYSTGNYDEGVGLIVDSSYKNGSGGAGGSGIVIIRWGDWSTAA